jgi:prolipoprotein diacylglyceryltransferase
VRFFLDFLRIDDARYFGLTPGQYASVLLVVVALLILRRAFRQETKPAAPQPSAS